MRLFTAFVLFMAFWPQPVSASGHCKAERATIARVQPENPGPYPKNQSFVFKGEVFDKDGKLCQPYIGAILTALGIVGFKDFKDGEYSDSTPTTPIAIDDKGGYQVDFTFSSTKDIPIPGTWNVYVVDHRRLPIIISEPVIIEISDSNTAKDSIFVCYQKITCGEARNCGEGFPCCPVAEREEDKGKEGIDCPWIQGSLIGLDPNACYCGEPPKPEPTTIPTTPPPPPHCAEGFSATEGCPAVITAIGSIATNPAEFVGNLLRFLIGIAGGIAVLLIIYAGYKMMTAQDNPETVQNAKNIITSAVVGLVFIAFSIVILELIGVDILKIPFWSY